MKVKFNQIKTMERESVSKYFAAEDITTLLNKGEGVEQARLSSEIPPALLSTLRNGLSTTDMVNQISSGHRGDFFNKLNPQPKEVELCQERKPLAEMIVKPDDIQAIVLGARNSKDNRQLLVIIQEEGTLVWQYDTEEKSWSIADDVDAIDFRREQISAETNEVSYSLEYTTLSKQTGLVSVAHLAFKEPTQSVKQLLVERTELDADLTVEQKWLEDILNGKSESSYEAGLNLVLAISNHLHETTGSESDRLPALGEGSLGLEIPNTDAISALNELNLGDIYAITFGEDTRGTKIVQIYTQHGIITYTRKSLEGREPGNWNLLSRPNAAWRFGYTSNNTFIGGITTSANQDDRLRNPEYLLDNSTVFVPFAVLYDEEGNAVESYNITEIYGTDPQMLRDIYSEAQEARERMEGVIATLNNRGEVSISSKYDHTNDIQRLRDQGIIETVEAVDLKDYHDLEQLPNTKVTGRLSHIDKIVLAKSSISQTYLLLIGPNGITVLECEDTQVPDSPNLIYRTWKLAEPILVEFGYYKAPFCIIQSTTDSASKRDYNIAAVFTTETRVEDQEK